jgi:predicted Zn-dependent protease
VRSGPLVAGSAARHAFSALLIGGLAAIGFASIGRPALAQDPCPPPGLGSEPLAIQPLLTPANVPPSPTQVDFRERLRTTPLGWPLRSRWCVWLEPDDAHTPLSIEQRRWRSALAAALREWRQELPIVEVDAPERAQVIVWRRRPPLASGANGRPRASHGRAALTLHRLAPGTSPALEPRVEVWISPGQRLEAIQATALHELGHAFGLWGHSDNPADAMAAAPAATPILRLSERDRATLRWLYQQATPLRSTP